MRKATTPMEVLAAQNLKRIFEDRKYGPQRLTQKKLAEMVGFSQQATVSQFLLGRNVMSVETISKFAHALEVDPEEIRPDFFDLLHLKQPPRSLAIVPVRESLTGAPLSVRTLRITTTMTDNTASHYAVLIDSERYRAARIRPRSHLIVAEDLEPSVDDDVFVVTTDGTKHVAVFIAQNDEHLMATSLEDGQQLIIPLTELQVCDVIVGVENPKQAR